MKMGPTKTIVDENKLYDAKTGQLIKAEFTSRKELEQYATHHYIVLPVVDNGGRTCTIEGKPVYCLHGVEYETLDESVPHARRCPDCGGIAVPIDEVTVDRGCVRCIQCGHEFDARLEMMES